MLFELIYNFFIEHVFGGSNSSGTSYVRLGTFLADNGSYLQVNTSNITALELTSVTGTHFQFPLGNYLSLIASIITIVAILLFCVFIIKKIIGIIFRLFTGSSAF